jgi:hypothetical protein
MIDFGKLLVGKEATRQVVIKNVTLLPIHWKMTSSVTDFIIDTTKGTLAAGQEEVLNILFRAKDEVKLEQSLEFEVEDVEGRSLVNRDIPNLQLLAEGFYIKTRLSGFDAEENFFDFGDVQVAHQVQKQFKLENLGIYPIRYSLEIYKKQFKNVFSVEPSKGTLESNEEVEVKVMFQSTGEVFLKSGPSKKDMGLRIIESHSGQVYEEHRIKLKVNSQYNQFNLNPMKSLNFSAIIFGETKTKYFQINNTGLFDLHFFICDKKDRQEGKQSLQRLIEQGSPFEVSSSNNKGRHPLVLSI